MNAHPSQFPSNAPKGPFSRLMTFMVVQLATFVDWSKVPLKGAHVGGAEGVTFGTNSCTVGDLITMDSQTPTAAGQIGMNAATGTPLVYVSGASRSLIADNDSRLSDKRTANALYDSTATFAIGAIGDGEFLRRSGSTVIGAAVNSAILISAAAGMDIFDYGPSVSTIPNVVSVSGGTDV